MRTPLLRATLTALTLVAMTAALPAAHLLPTANAQEPTVAGAHDPGPVGDFHWKGYNWERRISAWGGGPTYNGKYDAANVVGPDENGHLRLRITNPTGRSPIAADMWTTRRGFGYGTYTTVVEKQLHLMQPEVVWGCLFTYDRHNAPGYTEIDVCEASAWGGGSKQNEPVVQGHGYWFDATLPPGKGNVVENFVASRASVQTHRLVWEPQRLTFETYEGEGFEGPLFKRTVLTGSTVPVPTNEALSFNLWVFGGNGGTPDRVGFEEVVIRDFSFVPAGETPPSDPGDATGSDPVPTPGTDPAPGADPAPEPEVTDKPRVRKTPPGKAKTLTSTSATVEPSGERQPRGKSHVLR